MVCLRFGVGFGTGFGARFGAGLGIWFRAGGFKRRIML